MTAFLLFVDAIIVNSVHQLNGRRESMYCLTLALFWLIQEVYVYVDFLSYYKHLLPKSGECRIHIFINLGATLVLKNYQSFLLMLKNVGSPF